MADSAGQTLRAAREASGQSLEDVARVTRIRPARLAALETDDYAALPSLTQARGFIKLYAEHLGLDPEDVLERYDASSRRSILPVLRIPSARASARAVTEAHTASDASKASRRPAAPRPPPQADQRPDARPPAMPQVRRRGLRILSADVFVAVIITMVLVSLLVWGGSQLASGAATAPTATRASLLAQPSADVPALATATPEPVATETPTPSAAFSGVNVTVRAEQRSWVSVTVDGVPLYSGLMPPGEARDFVAQNVIEVVTGNGRGTRIIFNGVDQGTLGEVGEVVTRQWTLQGMVIPTAAPLVAP